jgi:hypothetical protein
MKKVAGTSIDPTVQFAELKIDDTTYKLVYGFAAIALAESTTKTNLLNGFLNLTSLNAQQLIGLTYAAMLPAQPKITYDKVAALFKYDQIYPIMGALAECYSLSLPEKKRVEGDEPNQEPTSTLG